MHYILLKKKFNKVRYLRDSRMASIKQVSLPVRCEEEQAAAGGRPGYVSLTKAKNQPEDVPGRPCSSHPDPVFPDS